MLSCENALQQIGVLVTKHTILALFCSIFQCFITRITATTRKNNFWKSYEIMFFTIILSIKVINIGSA